MRPLFLSFYEASTLDKGGSGLFASLGTHKRTEVPQVANTSVFIIKTFAIL